MTLESVSLIAFVVLVVVLVIQAVIHDYRRRKAGGAK